MFYYLLKNPGNNNLNRHLPKWKSKSYQSEPESANFKNKMKIIQQTRINLENENYKLLWKQGWVYLLSWQKKPRSRVWLNVPVHSAKVVKAAVLTNKTNECCWVSLISRTKICSYMLQFLNERQITFIVWLAISPKPWPFLLVEWLWRKFSKFTSVMIIEIWTTLIKIYVLWRGSPN